MLQEQVTKLKMGTIPRSMWVTLEDDLVDSSKPGDDVVIWLVLLWETLGSFYNVEAGI